jgi:predicted Zn-dependent peptidase
MSTHAVPHSRRPTRTAPAVVALALAALFALGPLAGPARADEDKPLPAELPPFGEDKPLPVPDIVQSTLDNGLTVWVVPREGLPKVTALLMVRGGTASDPAELAGTAEVFAETLRSGTASRSSKQIAEELQAIGGDLYTGATDDAMYLQADGLATGVDRLLEVLGDVAMNPAFPAEEVALEKANSLQSLQAEESTPEFAVGKAFAAAIFGDHPYRIVAPEEAAIEAVTPESLRAEHARRFRPDRTLLLVVGDLDREAVAAAARRVFAGWSATGEPPAAVPEAPESVEHKFLLVPRPGSVQSQIRVGRPAVEPTHQDYYPLVVANTIFGGSFGSRLTENLREEKGYTYSPGSGLQALREGGSLTVRAAVRNEVTAPTLLEIFYELDRMGATRVTDAELNQAKRYQTGLYLLRNQIQGWLAQTLATNWAQGLPPEAAAEFVPKVEAVTAEQVREVSRKWLPSRKQVVVVGGDVEAIRPELELFGEAEVVTP